MDKELSIYVHIPFCVRKCNYCDFLSFHAEKELVARYFETLKKEIRCEAALLSENGSKEAERRGGAQGAQVAASPVVTSIFFGGGTPSFVDAKMICDVLDTIKSSFVIKGDAEISIEVNPASAMFDKLLMYREAGFNRISIGAQSLNDKELKVLGRVHNSDMFFETFENAKKAGFTNINVDVMSALPGQSLDSYLDTLNKVLSLRPQHISAYSLIIEEGTPFYDMELDLPDEETDRAMYHETKALLAEAGYHRYEISNYALEGYECRHNKVYWQRGNYLGLGIGAASMVDNVRWSNVRDINEYIKAFEAPASGSGDIELIRCDVEELPESSQMEEFMFLGLRLVEGVSLRRFEQLFNKKISDVYGRVIDKYASLGLLEKCLPDSTDVEDEHLRLTDQGLDVSNTVMAEFLL